MTLANLEKLFLFLTLLFLPTQLGRHFWPQFSYVYSLRIDYLSPTIYLWDLTVLFLIIVFILRREHIKKLALNLYLAFILTQLLSLLPIFNFSGSLNLGPGLVRLEQYLFSGLWGVYIASKQFKQIKTHFFWGLGLAILGEGILAVAQFFQGGSIGFWILGERTFSLSTPAIAKFDFQGIQFLRPYATFPHPNVLAAFMVITAPLLGMEKHPIKTVTSFVAGAVTLLTVSRVAIVTWLISTLLLMGKRGRILLVLVTIVLIPVLYTRFSAAFNFDNLSILRREELAEEAVDMFLHSPILGVGLNNFVPQASDRLLIGPSRFLQPVHNIFLLSLSETGIVGLLGLILLIGIPIFKLLKKSSFRDQYIKTLIIVWFGIVFLGMFDHYFLTLPQGYRLIFLIWGLSLSMLELKGEKSF